MELLLQIQMACDNSDGWKEGEALQNGGMAELLHYARAICSMLECQTQGHMIMNVSEKGTRRCRTESVRVKARPKFQ